MIDHKTIIVGTVAFLVVGYVLKQQAKAAAETVGEAINPTSTENIFYRGVNGIIRVFSDNPDQTLGGAIYDTFHGPDEYKGLPHE